MSTGAAEPAGTAHRAARRRRHLLVAGALACGLAGGLLALAGCGSRPAAAPEAAPARPAAAAAVAPSARAPAQAAPAAAALPAPVAARSWDEFKRNAGRRLVAAHPKSTYMGTPPEILFGIPVIETELNADGSVRNVNVLRRPSNPQAADTVQIAVDAIRRAGPYGDVSRLPRPWKWVETFLFNDERQFKPRSLD